MEKKLTGKVVWVAQTHRLIADRKYVKNSEIQLFPIDEFDEIRHLYNGLESLVINPLSSDQNIILIKHPFKPDTYCELKDDIDLDFIDDKFTMIENICANLGAKKCSFKYVKAKSHIRKQELQVGFNFKLLFTKILGDRKRIRKKTKDLNFDMAFNPNFNEDSYNKAVESAEKNNLRNDNVVISLLNQRKPSAPVLQKYDKDVIVNESINELLDVAFTLSGIPYLNSLNLECINKMQYKEEIKVHIHIEF